jgi:tRNA(Arg) A34 adenosine deaminase TadA
MAYKITVTAECFDKRGRRISWAANSYSKTHPLQAYFAKKVGHKAKIYLHAEIAAILKAGDKLINSIVIRRLNKEGKLCLAKPCPICQEAIKAFGIKLIFYSCDNEMSVERI